MMSFRKGSTTVRVLALTGFFHCYNKEAEPGGFASHPTVRRTSAVCFLREVSHARQRLQHSH
jgi:hypothetical protein